MNAVAALDSLSALGIVRLPLFVGAGLLLNLTPGPDVLYIVTHALRSGSRAGMVAALGITAGCFVHIVAAAVGVSALIAASATAFTVLKWLGAAYLMWVGALMLFSRKSSENPGAITEGAPGQKQISESNLKNVFLQGFWTNVLNPKVALFFLAFLPQFISPDADHPTLAFLVLGLVFNFNGLWVNAAWALLAAGVARRFSSLNRGMHWLQRAAGALFMGFGLKLALTGSPPQ